MLCKGPVIVHYRTCAKTRYTASMKITFRPTTQVDTPILPDIEHSAGQRFLRIPSLAWLADGHTVTLSQHQHYVDNEMSWLALADNSPVGFLLAEPIASSLFIAEVSLHLGWQGKGIGRGLIRYVAEQAREKGYASLTLTTFRDVPWNAPFYAGLGFEMLTDEALSTPLRQKRKEEAAHGLAFESRCAMRLILR